MGYGQAGGPNPRTTHACVRHEPIALRHQGEQPMKRSNQKGVALLMTLILVLVISVMAASMMFLAQSETLSSVNYRLMTQARYGAEAGFHAAADYLTNSTTGYP